jgi:hypothetical protein
VLCSISVLEASGRFASDICFTISNKTVRTFESIRFILKVGELFLQKEKYRLKPTDTTFDQRRNRKC